MANLSYFQDTAFQDLLLALACRDQVMLRQCGSMLTAKDFRPLQGQPNGQQRWVIAQIAFEYWLKYKEPVSDLLPSEVKAYCGKANLAERQVQDLVKYAETLIAKKLVGTSSVVERALTYKKERLKAATIQQLIEEQQSGTLSDERWVELSRKAIEVVHGGNHEVSDYLEGLDGRMIRRANTRLHRHPSLMIQPLDQLVHAIARGELGLVLAPFKRGKSLCLIWIALAYIIQRLNVLYITLEDPKDEVEDRLDQCVTGLTGENLRDVELENIVRKRYQRFRRYVKAKLHVVDGTEGDVSVAVIDDMVEQERQKGFLVDAVIVDYDDEIKPPRKQAERRFEFADIYVALRQLAARRRMFLWTAAQTQRDTEELKVITANKLAEDISKVRKVTMAFSIGKGEWGEHSFYLYVAAHKTDQSHVGCNIFANPAKGMFYNHLRTLRKNIRLAEKWDSETSASESRAILGEYDDS